MRMKMIYELWDDDTGNLLDAYDTEQAALKDVRATIETDGRDAVASSNAARVLFPLTCGRRVTKR